MGSELTKNAEKEFLTSPLARGDYLPSPGASRRSLRSKLWLVFGGLLLILVTVSALSAVALTRYSRAFEKVFHENYDSVVYCDAMKEALDGLDSEAQHLLWDVASKRPQFIEKWDRQFSDNILLQRHNCFLFHEQEKSDAIGVDWQRFRSEYARFVSGAFAGDRHAAYRDALLPQTDSLRDKVQDLIGMNLRNMVAVDGQVRGTTNAVRQALLLAAGAGSVLGLVFVAVAGPSMLRPLTALTRSARQIADGELDLKVEVFTRDEVGQLADAFNVMAERLREARRRDRDRLARTEQTTQMAIDSLPDAVVVLGPEGAIELTNRAATELFALTPRRSEAVPAWLIPLYKEVLNSGQRTETVGYRSAIQKFYAGEERFFLPHAFPLRADDGRAVGVTVVLADVTPLKHADEAKSNLVSTVSHELRTPLTSIRMAVHMLVEETFGPLHADQKQLLKTACDNSDRLHRILEHLLGISRIESGSVPLKLEQMSVAEIVLNAANSLQAAFDAAGITLMTAVHPRDTVVLADRNCIGYVLANLLSNALRHTPRNGVVRVVCRATDDGIANFTVSDTGHGIAEEHIPHVFEKFFRVATSDAPAGAGLGLAIAKEVVDAHGGRIFIDPAASRGATFNFTLRLATGRTPAISAEIESPGRSPELLVKR